MGLLGATGEDCQTPVRWVPFRYWFHDYEFKSDDAEFLSDETE